MHITRQWTKSGIIKHHLSAKSLGAPSPHSLNKGSKGYHNHNRKNRSSLSSVPCNSGRVIWRHDPLTRGCFEYQDLGDYTAKVNVCKRRSITAGQEYDPTEDDETAFLEEFSKDTNLQLKNAESLAKGDKGKGKGAKGSGSGQKGLGKGKGKHQQLALEDKKDESPEEEWEDALGKARRARDLVSTKQCEVEEALAKVPKSFLSAGLKSPLPSSKRSWKTCSRN